jgi:hypothetical protein
MFYHEDGNNRSVETLALINHTKGRYIKKGDENYFCPEDGVRFFLRNVNVRLENYTASHPSKS